jgi:hypothetical protein
MAFNDIYRLRIYGRLHGAQIVNVMHFVEDLTVLGGSGAQNLADDFRTNMLTPLRNRTSNQFTYEYVEVQSIVPFAGAVAVASWPAGTTGAETAQCQSATLAQVITIYTSRGGRSGRGRLYMCGGQTTTNDLSGGTWGSTQHTATVAFATALATRYMNVPYATSYALGVWSRKLAGPNPPWPTSAFVRASSLTVRTTCRTQRRRQVGVGR